MRVEAEHVAAVVKVRGEEMLLCVCVCLKANALISVLFMLKLNQGILESPACCVIVQLSTREKIEKWVTEREEQSETEMIMAPVVLGFLSHTLTAKLLTETD